MALGIGKKKADTANNDFSDFSEEALRAAKPKKASRKAAAGATTSLDAPANDEPFSERATRKKSPSRPLMMALGAVALAAVAGGAWMMSRQAPPEDTEAPAVLPSRSRPVAIRPNPAAKKPAAKPATAKVPAIKVPVAKAPGSKTGAATTVVRRVRPTAMGIAPPGTQAPAVRPPVQGAPPRVVPVPGTPAPVTPAEGMVALEGRRADRSVVIVAPPSQRLAPPPAALQAQLKALWREGAAAKQRGDYAGARRAWQQALQLRPGHPGFQEAINKLPQR